MLLRMHNVCMYILYLCTYVEGGSKLGFVAILIFMNYLYESLLRAGIAMLAIPINSTHIHKHIYDGL